MKKYIAKTTKSGTMCREMGSIYPTRLSSGGVVRICSALCLILFGISLPCALSAQEMSHPEHLAGRWEASDGQGGMVGMNILISTTIASSNTDLTSVLQRSESFDIGLYQRSGSDVEPFGFNFFSTSSTGGATWDGRHLRIALRQKSGLPGVLVDLLWNNADSVWTGTFERGAFQSKAITFRRPVGSQNNVLVGTWFDSAGVMNNCLHIAQAQDGTFTGWGDDIQIPDRMRYANGIRPPERTMEHYGEIAKISASGSTRIRVELRAYTPICCSHRFTAAISTDGKFLIGEWPTGPNQASHPAKWVRMQGDSCLSTSHR
jgi:hypothetical protein